MSGSLKIRNLYLLASSQEDEDSQEESQVFCEQCGKSWEPKTLLRHIGQNKECRKFYGARFDEMKRKKHKETMQRSREKKGTKEELKTQRESYEALP